MGQLRRVTPRFVAVAAVAAVTASVLGAGVGTMWARQRDHQHTATAVIMLHPSEGNAYSPGGRGDDLVNLETEAQLLQSDAVARTVLTTLKESGTPADLLAAIKVDVPPNTQLLDITARGPDDATAVARASAFAKVYLDYRRSRTVAAIADRTSRLEALVKLRESERNATVKKLDLLGSGDPRRGPLDQQAQELIVQISSLRAQLAAVQAVGLDPGQVVTPGQLTAPGPWASPMRAGLLGGVLALLLTLSVVVVRSGRIAPDVVRRLEDLADAGPTPLGVLRAPVRADSDVIAHARSVVLAAGSDRPPVVTVAPPARDKALTFAALVESFARARYEVVSVDLTRPDDVAAMASLVLQEAVVDDVLVEDGHFRSRLRPLADDSTAAVDPAAFGDLAASAEMGRSLAELAKHADLVLVRSPGFGTAVGRALLAASTAVLIEVRPGRCRRSEIDEVVAAAAGTDTQVVGLLGVDA
ncbi:hypothetical protein ABFU82_16530 [Nocardioides sp. WV_118_6]